MGAATVETLDETALAAATCTRCELYRNDRQGQDS